jgi:thiamine pyrophosphate-dependent acetolactate synthase large subunit-like protein
MGVLWSGAEAEFGAFVEAAGMPFYTTPQGRGVVPEDHAYCYLTARSTAFREADLILIVGTRMNYVIGHAAPPRSTPGRGWCASTSTRARSPAARGGWNSGSWPTRGRRFAS